MKISHMKKDELFEGFYLIKSADLRQTRAGKNYLAFTFQDDSGEIEGKLWDAQPHNVEAFTAGKVVHMKGRREVYNNTPQVNQITLRLPQPGEPNDPADFKVKSPVDVREIRDYMSQMIFKIENPVWQRIVSKALHQNSWQKLHENLRGKGWQWFKFKLVFSNCSKYPLTW